MLSKEERRLRASTAAHAGWAQTPDRTARTQPGRDGLDARIQRELVAKIGEAAWAAMTATDQEKALTSARRAHFAALSFKAAKARRARKSAKVAAS